MPGPISRGVDAGVVLGRAIARMVREMHQDEVVRHFYLALSRYILAEMKHKGIELPVTPVAACEFYPTEGPVCDCGSDISGPFVCTMKYSKKCSWANEERARRRKQSSHCTCPKDEVDLVPEHDICIACGKPVDNKQ